MLVLLVVEGVALAANMRSAKAAKRAVCFNILRKSPLRFQLSLLETFYQQESIGFIWEFPNLEKVFPKLGTQGEGLCLSDY
jgi:hypothetical protein